MNTRKIIGIILILGGVALGITGINEVASNDTSVQILDLKLDVSNNSGKQQGYMYLGIALILFVGGIYTINKK